jgi:putative toxin-antitoxin system antitoxin component (TIGR02293 family)
VNEAAGQRADQGLPTDLTNTISKHGLTTGEVNALIIPARTLKHRRSRRERLSKDESDKAIRSARILSQAQLVFGDDWMAWEGCLRPHAGTHAVAGLCIWPQHPPEH